MDPRDLFRQIFGGDAFVDIIGEISFVQMFAENGGSEQGSDSGNGNAISHTAASYNHSQEQRQRRLEREREAKRRRAERVQALYEKLLKKVSL